MYTEEDTFSALRKVPFNTLVRQLASRQHDAGVIVINPMTFEREIRPKFHPAIIAAGWSVNEFKKRIITL